MEAIKGMGEREESLKNIDLINECLSLIVFNFVYLSY